MSWQLMRFEEVSQWTIGILILFIIYYIFMWSIQSCF